MKIVLFIFSFYVLLLSTVPCCAADNCVEEIEQTTTDSNHSDTDDCKNCSPFALCGSCSGFTLSLVFLQMEVPQQVVSNQHNDFIYLYFPQSFSSFWQPPRLS